MESADRDLTFSASAKEERVSSLEIFSAKEDRSRLDCSGKHLGCLIWASKGLRYGLSGSRVAESGNVLNEVLKGNRPDRQRRVASGEIQPVPKP